MKYFSVQMSAFECFTEREIPDIVVAYRTNFSSIVRNTYYVVVRLRNGPNTIERN